jgi:hypothetical protein
MITAEQRAARKQFVCSSDAPAVCGVDPYRNAADVYYDKVGLADDFAGNANTDRGNILEPVLIDWAERQLGFPLGRNVFVEDYDGRPLACNLDACNADRRVGVEAKTVLARVEPTHCLPSIDVLKRMRRVPEQTREIPEQLLQEWIVYGARLSAAKKQAEDAQRALIAALGTAEGGTIGGALRVSYLEIARKGYTVEPTKYRSLKLVKAPAPIAAPALPPPRATSSGRKPRPRKHANKGSVN